MSRDFVPHLSSTSIRASGRGFTFTVLDPVDSDVIGCVYLYPTEWPGNNPIGAAATNSERAQ